MTQPGYGVENREPVSKIRTHLGLLFVIARKKVDGFCYCEKGGGLFFCDLEKEGMWYKALFWLARKPYSV